MSEDTIIVDRVKEYYGQVLQSNQDLKTSACCSADSLPLVARPLLKLLHPEVVERFYGCGSPIPPALEGCTVLDLGCGTGRDCYLFSKLVGPNGRVIGVDMTEEQLAVAERHRDYHAEAFGLRESNVEFHQGYMEDLAAVGIADASVDLVVSNCVLNLSPDKARVFAEIFRVLKPGGELYFADVFSNRRVPLALRNDPVLLGECLGGALYTEDFRRMMAAAGCADVRTVSASPIAITDPDIERKAGMIGFRSLTIRAFKLALEDRCEDYGQIARYRGTLEGMPHAFDLDDHHRLHTGKPLPVCGNTAVMLSETRYAPHIEVTGDRSVHYGLFDCEPSPATAPEARPGCC
ncbi:MAG: methyltransferase domain-containing protein [Gammaproteobacteria bacterium]